MNGKSTAMLAAAGLWAIASGAQAQPAADQPTQKMEILGEVVVTARRRAEALQDVPQTVNVVTSQTLDDYAVIDFQDLSQLIPGLTLEDGTTGHTSNASVRGVRFQVEAQAGGPTTEFYINEVPIEANSVFQAQYDLGQIEVLKGPQGTLRGRSAPSGAFTLTTQAAQPSGGWNGYAATTFDDHDGMNIQAAMNVPILEDVLAVRFAGQMDENDSNGIRSITTDREPFEDTDSYRVSLAFTPGDAFRARLMYQRLDRVQETYGILFVGPGASPANASQPALTLQQNRSIKDNPDRNEQQVKIATVNLDYAFAGQLLSYTGGWNDYVLEDNEEADNSNFIRPALPLGSRPDTQYKSHEIRLASEERLFNGLLDYTVGAFYQNQAGVTNFPSTQGYWPGSFGPAGAPDPTTVNLNYKRLTRIISTRDNEEKSLFAGVDLHLVKNLELSLGARHIISQRDQLIVARQEGTAPGGVQRVNLGAVANCTGTTSGAALFGAAGFTLGTATREPSPFYPGTCDAVFSTPFGLNLSPPVKDEIKNDVWNTSLSYKITENHTVYATAGTSFRNGAGFVVGTPGVNCQDKTYCQQYVSLATEESIAYEAGFKSFLFNRRGYVEFAAFQQKFDGFIVRGIGVPYRRDNGTITSGVFTYNADAIVTGFDALFSYDLTDDWDAGLSASYADGRYDNAQVPCRDSNFDGIPDAGALPGASATNTLGTAAAWDAAGGPGGPALCASDGSATRAPLWNATLRTQYEFPTFAGTTGFVRGLYTYYPHNKNADENQNFVADSYGVLNLYAGLRSDKRSWEVSVFARNVLDDDTVRTYSDDPVTETLINTNPVTRAPYFPQTVEYRRFSRVGEREIGVTLRYNFGQ